MEDISVTSQYSPMANPPITMDNRTGEFQLIYLVQSSDRVAGRQAVDLIPLEYRISEPFEVLPPME